MTADVALTPADLSALREAAEKATPGPWEQDDEIVTDVFALSGYIIETTQEQDAAYIALCSPDRILTLLGMLEGRAWRCFHCDEIFTSADTAKEHFGAFQECTPLCRVDAKQIRELEHELSSYRTESDEVSKAFHGMMSDHTRALIREEEKGYAKGVADMRAQLSTAIRERDEAIACIKSALPWLTSNGQGAASSNVIRRARAILAASDKKDSADV